MDNRYIVVRANSTSGPYIVERNECAPRVNTWTKADVAGYANTQREAKAIAREANENVAATPHAGMSGAEFLTRADAAFEAMSHQEIDAAIAELEGESS